MNIYLINMAQNQVQSYIFHMENPVSLKEIQLALNKSLHLFSI